MTELSRIEICEVGPRDGLQSEPRLWSVDERVESLMTAAAALVVINPELTLDRAIAEVTELWEHRNKSRLS